MTWIYDLPTLLFGLLCLVTFTILGIVGYYVTGPIVRMLMGPPPGHNQGVDVMIGAVTLLYGLILTLMAVAVWGEATTASTTVSEEAASMRVLHRSLTAYPEPDRSTLRTELGDYTKSVIDDDWPAQRRGVAPPVRNDKLYAFQKTLFAFNPKSEAEKVVHESTLREFDKMIELRSLRLHSIAQGISSLLWAVILVGALLTIMATYFLQLERVLAQLTMTTFVSIVIAIIIFMTASMDHPFQGRFGVGPGAFQINYDWMESRNAAAR